MKHLREYYRLTRLLFGSLITITTAAFLVPVAS